MNKNEIKIIDFEIFLKIIMEIPQRIQFVQFGVLSAEQIRKFSRAEMTRPASKGGADKDRTGTPYDERMGVLENGKPCLTCLKTNQTCDGHFGHINLPIPIYNKRFIDTTLKILQCICPSCAKCRIPLEHVKMQGLLKFRGINRLKQIASRCAKPDTGKTKITKRCPWPDCNEILPIFILKDEIKQYFGDKTRLKTFTASETLNVFLRIDEETLSLLGFNDDLSKREIFQIDSSLDVKHIHQVRPESFILTVLPVIPPCARPFVIRDGETCDDDLTDLYNTIIKLCNKIREDDNDRSRKRTDKKDADKQKAILELPNKVWTLMDNRGEKSKLSSGGRPHKCLFQRIGSKEGHVQNNIGGKRCDFTARSVIIGGGTDIAADEVGVPRYIAEELTKPIRVTDWNIDYAQKLVSEGKVNRVIRYDRVRNYERIIRLKSLPENTVYRLEIGDKIERQLEDNDWVIVNRQPTLRLESMTALKARIVDGYAIRLPLNICPYLNSDYDGDNFDVDYFI